MNNEKVRLLNPCIIYLARLLRGNFRETLHAEGLFAGQHELIGMMYYNPGIAASALAKKLDLTQATVSVSLKRLEKVGFVKREIDESDSRVTKLFLTDDGKNVHKKIEEAIVTAEDKLVLGMTDEEIRQFRGLLLKGIHNLVVEDENSQPPTDACFEHRRKRGDKQW